MNELTQRPMLLLLEQSRQIYPLNPTALKVAQNTRKRLKRYSGEHLLDQEGILYVIRSIAISGWHGNTLMRKLTSALSGVYSINTKLEEADRPSMEELKALLIRFIQYDAQNPEPNLIGKNSVAALLQRIAEAESIEGVFLVLNLPSLEDCLDVL